jgi:hypothetical protein
MTSKGHGPKHSKLDAAAFASNQLSLLEKERLAEVAEVSDALTTFSPSQLQARGLALLNLVIESVRTGLGGRTYLHLQEQFHLLMLSGWSSWVGIHLLEEVQFLHMPFGQGTFVDCSRCSLAQQRRGTWLRHGRLPSKELYPGSERRVSL